MERIERFDAPTRSILSEKLNSLRDDGGSERSLRDGGGSQSVTRSEFGAVYSVMATFEKSGDGPFERSRDDLISGLISRDTPEPSSYPAMATF